MKITICGSVAFIDEMLQAKQVLENQKHEVKMPPTEIPDSTGALIPVKQFYSIRKATTTTDGWIWNQKEAAMRRHFDKVIWADAIVVLNHDKNNVSGYIGPNTLLEMGLAFHHRKPIYLLQQIPEVNYKEEILAMRPIVVYGDLSKIQDEMKGSVG